MIKFINKHRYLSLFLLLIVFYILICVGLYFFEPAHLSEPDLNDYKHYFDSYKKYSVSKDFFIKQLTTSDIAHADDKRIKYVDNTILVITESNITSDELASLSHEMNFEITGKIQVADFYQLTFAEQMSFADLNEICRNLTDSDYIKIAIPDFFEETPASETSTDNAELLNDYYKLIEIESVWNLLSADNTVNIGMIDFYADYSNDYLNIQNQNEYSVEYLQSEFVNGSYKDDVSHGTHVAGIIGASHKSETPGVIDNAKIYSYNGINVSTSYWVANICDMIINNNVKAINVSMGYNSYITMSAALGCTNAIAFITNEQIFFSELLSNLIQKGYEFVICTAAGNSNNDSAYRIFNGYFSFGDKKILSKLDIFRIFDSKPDYVDAAYSYFLSYPVIESVTARTLVVGAVNSNGKFSSYSNSGKVDICAPGENINSTSISDNYEIRYGTSMATPFVTGAAAMLFSLDCNISGAEVKSILINSAEFTVSADGCDFPVLNVENAVSSLRP